MYEDWLDIESEVLDFDKCRSVLHTYPSHVGKDVAKSVIASLCINYGNSTPTETQQDFSSPNVVPHLDTICQVEWTMEIICFGLTLTLTEFETLKDSVLIYLEWLSVGTDPKANIPQPIRNNPLPFIRKMVEHLENLFIPRSEGANGNQLALCHTVLTAIQNLANKSTILDRLTWEVLLKFVLKVSDTILSPSSIPSGLAEQICDLLMYTFFKVWLLACRSSFPSPSFWKTAKIFFSRWRHHLSVVEWWSRLVSATTSKVLKFMYGDDLPELKVAEEHAKIIPNDITHEVLIQAWFRILHLISDPSDLWNKQSFVSTSTDDLNSNEPFDNLDQLHHLKFLPLIFLKAIKGLSSVVDAFLGLPEDNRFEVTYPNISASQISHSVTPTTSRKSSKTKKSHSTNTVKSSTTSLSSTNLNSSCFTLNTNLVCGVGDSMEMRIKPNRNRSQCNSILHLFGEWLFDAALAGTTNEKDSNDQRQRMSSPSQPSASSFDGISVYNPMFGNPSKDSAEAGRAEACGVLCRVFSSKKSGEQILPAYVCRFYLVLNEGLLGGSKQVLASIILNSVDLFRIDLPGVTTLLPTVITALETIVPDRELAAFKPFLNVVHLRRAAIHLLVSMIPITLHHNLEDFAPLPYETPSSNQLTFNSLRRSVIDLLTGALQAEVDPVNTQMILGSLLFTLQDSALFTAASDQDQERISPKSTIKSLPVETPHGLFIQIILLVTRKLDTWKYDVTISLAALELLSGLAKMKIDINDKDESVRAIRQLCQYITSQCERPRPQHKRELHSMIVTAFHTLGTWLIQHPYLTDDRQCLLEVLGIIELGLSGSKSKSSDADVKEVMKEEKKLNPVSKRVQEAAETLLVLLFEQLGAFPSPCSPSSTCSLLDEKSLLQAFGIVDKDISQSEAISHYRYFGLNGGILAALLEHTHERDHNPSVTMLLRSATSKRVWTFQLRQTPLSDKLSAETLLKPFPRPKPLAEGSVSYRRKRPRVFPEEVDSIPLVKADCSIPLLKDVPSKKQSEQIEKLNELIEEQAKYEADISRNMKVVKMPECVAPDPVKSYQAARMLLSHFNFLSLDSIWNKTETSPTPNELGSFSVMINEKDPTFGSELEHFDSISTRVHDTAFIFYVKAGQSSRKEVLGNMNGHVTDLQPTFSEFLLSLGWVVNRDNHPGWCGSHSNHRSSKPADEKDGVDLQQDGIGVFNGDRFLLYYADVSTEVAFIVPTSNKTISSVETINKPSEPPTTIISPTDDSKMILEFIDGVLPTQESPSSPTVRSKKMNFGIGKGSSSVLVDSRVAIFWCESYDSIEDVNVDQFEAYMSTHEEQLPAIFIHPLESGLFLIRIKQDCSATSKSGFALPALSGSVVSRRSLGIVIRTTLMNMCSRYRLAAEYCSPHVRRKQQLLELITKFQHKCTPPDFFTRLFDPTYKEAATIRNFMFQPISSEDESIEVDKI